MAEDDPIFQGDFVKLSESRRLFIGSKADTWKPKHILLRRKTGKPILEYHKKKQKNSKKGEKTLTNSFELWPTFKVEKLTNARGRAFVCEITAPDIHQFVSSDQESDIDIFVFLLQSQIRLKENLREDIISVVPDESEAQTKIGAKGSKCFLHISPWGITLALTKSRALLAQWPLKSIRYYETSGSGHFTIEAGRVAPMGEGVFGFQTAAGEDDKTYDLVDNYIVNTLDRVKPNQRGTHEEIEDYIREHDFLHSLTMIHARNRTDPEIKNALFQCWNIGRKTGQTTDSIDLQSTPLPTPSTTNIQTSSLHVTLDRTISSGQGSSNTLPADARSSKRSLLMNNDSSQMSQSSPGRPPLPGRAARRSRRRDHSLPRKVDIVENTHHQSLSLSDEAGSSSSPRSNSEALSHVQRISTSEGGGATGRLLSKTPELPCKQGHGLSSISSSNSIQAPRRHSNPSNVLHAVNNMNNDNSKWTPLTIQPYQNQEQTDEVNHQHTEFYNLNSPNLKIRMSKSPIVTRHPNKVGRAEYLLSVQESGVRSPSSPEGNKKISGNKWDLSTQENSCPSEEENQETKKYMEAVARASKKKYGGGHNSLDRTWVNGKQEGERVSLGMDSLLNNPESSRSSSSNVNAPKVSGGYVNLSNNQDKMKLQDRQISVESFSSALSRQSSVKNTPSSPPAVVHHHRQRSAPVETDLSANPCGYQYSPSLLRKKGGGNGNSSHEDSGVSLRSRNSQLSSDDGLSRDSTHSIGSFKSAVSRQPSGFSTLDSMTSSSPVTNWLMSASCEDLSDHMRHVIFQDSGDHDRCGGENVKDYESTYEEIRNTDGDDGNCQSGGDSCTGVSTNSVVASTTSDDKPPLPFTGLKKFQNNASNGYSGGRDRSKSFGYMNMPQPTTEDSPAIPIKQPSSAPSAHLIRKMVSARTKQDTLRKSLSNPNFLNLGSKEQLFKLKMNSRNNINSSSGNLSSGNNNIEKLNSGAKQKSRSFGNLFPAIKKALSRESIGHQSRSTTPERRSSFRRSSFSLRRRSSEHDVGLRRQNSLHTPGEMTIKGIRMTTRSRSFRRVRETKSVEGLSTMVDSDISHPADYQENELSTTTYATIISRSDSPDIKSSKHSSNSPKRPSETSSSSSNLHRKQINARKSSASAKLRTASSNSSLKTLPTNQTESSTSSKNSKTKSSTQQHLTTSSSSSSLKAMQDGPVSTADIHSFQNSNHPYDQNQSDPAATNTCASNPNTSYSANLSITLSSPQNNALTSSSAALSVSSKTTNSEQDSNSFVTDSSPTHLKKANKPVTNPTIAQPADCLTALIPSATPPPPPLPPRQKSISSISTPISKSKLNPVSTASPVKNFISSSSSSSSALDSNNPSSASMHNNKSNVKSNSKYNRSGTNTNPVTSTAFISPNYINSYRSDSSNENKTKTNTICNANHNDIKPQTARVGNTMSCTSQDSTSSSLFHHRKDNASSSLSSSLSKPSTIENPARHLSNGKGSERASRPSRRRTGFDS